MKQETIWRPQPRQAAFMRRAENEALFGGAAGGGKSDALVNEALRQVDIPHYKGLILRKTFPQLAELVDKTHGYYKRAYPKARYNAQTHTWTFPSGAKIVFGSLQHSKDRLNYQGHAYDFIGFDELTQFHWEEYSYLFSRNRPNGAGTRVYMRATANPGGIGHAWVKERFISAGEAMKTIWNKVQWRTPDGETHSSRLSRIFVPSLLFDNPALMKNDPRYIQRLADLPEQEMRALLYGDWDTFSGQVFMEWRNAPEHYEDRAHTHVIEPFRIPESWKVIRGFDWGYSRPFSVGWYAVDHDRRLYRIRELYGCTGTPNQGVKWEPARVAREIKRIEGEDRNLKGRSIRGIADPSIFNNSGMESIAALMERERVYWERGDNARIGGKMQLHHRMHFDENGYPMLYVFDTCKHFIRTIPALVYDDTDVEDVDTDGEDHIYDECRYVCMENPISIPVKEAAKPKVFNPLETYDLPQYPYFYYPS